MRLVDRGGPWDRRGEARRGEAGDWDRRERCCGSSGEAGLWVRRERERAKGDMGDPAGGPSTERQRGPVDGPKEGAPTVEEAGGGPAGVTEAAANVLGPDGTMRSPAYSCRK